ncbi:MAG: cytochrome d ubiquinol oxidase subunit II [unclassified Hahellaceae]|nr:cytochrome d ubiquinol oxidase subunit II [Hahellaceae bacterium]|tara:strand:+ start:22708 stop:23715 length:1008 start_codon:yes stop_codon:yes gene_type:complete
MDLALIWAGILAFAVGMYVVLDGFDLGVGILFPTGSAGEKNIMINTIAPVWDGNETWLVLGGGGLFAVFPLAYAIIMPALYMPLIIMLLALVFRGVAFEFRFKTKRGRYIWDWSFFAGSLVAALMQGLMLGAILQGIKVEGRAYAGGWFDWLTPFSIFCAFAVVAGYVALGSTWLILKTSGPLQDRQYRIAKLSVYVLLGCIGFASVYLPWAFESIQLRWFSFPNTIVFILLPIFAAYTAWRLLKALALRSEKLPYFATIALFILSGMGFGISIFPYMVPHSVNIWQAAAPDDSLLFLLVGSAVLIPMILAYTGYSYWVFRGKLDKANLYHADHV